MFGTIVNCTCIIGGCLIGLLLKGKLSDKISSTIMNGLALCALYIGISGALKGEDTLQIIICIAAGTLIGELIDIDKRLNYLGKIIERRLNCRNTTKKEDTGEVSIAEGFVTASLLFCVGAMAIVGALESGLRGDYTILFAKSVLDGVSAIIFTSSLGIGVMLSSMVVFIYQGIITILAGCISTILNDVIIANMSAVGSILIIGLSFNILGISKIRVANMIPAIFIPIIFGLF
ncbi:DUF554 domain-containing protein [Clostridium botulinum]|uniref:Membrane protein n=1 Tax=Clostridium botulinum (strain Eklund 17B / Type B) TaxID=935198 RepID=B2TN07_CLOBB|nr:putative membrane protein [Clostridium botulinum B str. Eklund 17B (NRP)]MBY6975133.1 DUF554 domain-containing protein [Clostridium botulinum]MBY7000114.1 DUF554 domain-containing protein [Clostridium botulinum]MCR1274888.1 DUF554 domain-containing protein [Clostridium botulinum]NFD68687.1 DUF554 domain-containing protein [Clostridium botulinum]